MYDGKRLQRTAQLNVLHNGKDNDAKRRKKQLRPRASQSRRCRGNTSRQYRDYIPENDIARRISNIKESGKSVVSISRTGGLK